MSPRSFGRPFRIVRKNTRIQLRDKGSPYANRTLKGVYGYVSISYLAPFCPYREIAFERKVMTRPLIRSITLVGVCLLVSNAAYAQLQNHLELNVFGAGSFYSKNSYEIGYPQSPTPIPGELKFDATWRGGLRIGVYTRGHWGQEFYYSYEPNTVTFTSSSTGAPTELDVRTHNYGINALYYLVETESHPVQPFLSTGIGGSFYHLTSESLAFVRDPARGNLPDVNSSNELAFNIGVGVKSRLRDWVGFRADIRDVMGRTPSFGLARDSADPSAAVLPASGVQHNAEASVGVVFYFGKR